MSQNTSNKWPSCSSTKTNFNFDLPRDYVVSKFYEYGYKVSHNKYSNTYNSCCPICREGKSWGRKKRCFYIPDNKNIFCHNCGSSLPPYQWIRKVSGMSHDDIVKSVENDACYVLEDILSSDKIKPTIGTLPEDSINLFDDIQMEYYRDNPIIKIALDYVRFRRLDVAINRPDALYISLKDRFQCNRLIIPFKDDTGRIAFYQTRRILDTDDLPDYLSKPNSDKTIYGINNIHNDMDSVFLFEGPIDSFFVQNGLGVAGINKGHFTFTKTQQAQMQSLVLFDKIWVLDNQWADSTARAKTFTLLESGEKVFIWPKKYKEFKDLNELCVHYKLSQISPEFVKKNSKSGKSAITSFKLTFGSL